MEYGRRNGTAFQTTSGSHTNETSRYQFVYILQPDVYDPWTATVSCDLPEDGHGGQAPSPEALERFSQGFVPYFYDHDGVRVALPRDNHATCKWVFHYEDSWQIPTDCGYKVFRHWQWYNWCEENHVEPYEYTQVIEVTDVNKPVLTCPRPEGKGDKDNPVIVGTNLGSEVCGANVVLGHPTVDDNCDPDPQIEFLGVFDAETNALVSTTLSDIPLDGCSQSYYAMWTAYDKCGNKADNCRTYFNIEDDDEPICRADEYTVTQVDDETGEVVICAQHLDSGSKDNCTPQDELRMLISKKASGPYSECLTLSCDDLFSDELDNQHDLECPGTVNIWFKVIDNCDNEGTCMVEVELQDKEPPVIVGGPNKTENCDDVDDPMALFNTPTASDNCDPNPEVKEIRREGGFDDCLQGSMTITWEATDRCGNKATTSQTVTIIHVSDFVVEFPKDVDRDCASDLGKFLDPQPGDGLPYYPEVSDDDCEKVLISKVDKVFTSEEEACLKIRREWHVVNWCVNPDAEVRPYDDTQLSSNRFRDGGNGHMKYVQIIVLKDDEAPVITCEPDVTVDDQTADCDGPVTLSATATDNCTDTEDIDISYRIDAFVGTANEVIGLIEGDGGSLTETFPYGTHRVVFTATDDCGNSSSCSQNFTIRDAKKPGIGCTTFLSWELMPIDTDGDGSVDNGMAEIWAREFVASYSDNCPSDCDPTDEDTECFRIDDITSVYNGPNDPYGGASPTTPPSSAALALTFDCSDYVDAAGVPLPPRRIAVWARDEAGNWDFCVAVLELQNHMGACVVSGTTGSLAGTIETENSKMVENVTVDIVGADMPSAVTDITGAFSFLAPQGGTYTVEPKKDMNLLNGVNTLDIVLISQHILGTQELNSPYKRIAADVNKSGDITGNDVIAIRQLLLNKIDAFPNNESWRFVDKSFEFADPTNPWSTPFPEVISVEMTDAVRADFVGVKIGDVDGDVAANNLTGSTVRNSVGSLVFTAADAQVAAGEEYTIDFRASDIKDVKGYQFTMNFDATSLEFVDVASGALPEMSINNYGLTRLEEGVITTSWNSNDVSELAADDILFSMTFRAKRDVKMSEAISLNSRYLSAQAYGQDLSQLDVAIEFSNTTVTADAFELYQNAPNPFNNETRIGFSLPQSGTATLRIFDVTGKQLKQYDGEYAKGYNEIIIRRGELPTAGVLYYQLSTANDSATRKMIVIDE